MKQKQADRLDQLAQRLENSGVADYVRLSLNMRKILWLDFLSGVARGLGFTIGTSIILALAYKVLGRIISMNIPYITETLRQFTEIIKGP